jgi:flagellar motor protein MotB
MKDPFTKGGTNPGIGPGLEQMVTSRGPDLLGSSPSQGVGEAGEESWIVSLSDLMTLLLIFFLVWATFEIKANSENGSQAHKTAALFTNKEALVKGLEALAPVVRQADGLVLILSEKECFTDLDGRRTDPARGRLSQKGLVTLSRLAGVLKGENGYEILITGHMDRQPLMPNALQALSNIELSMGRAGAVLGALASFGIDPHTMRIQALGAMEPVEGTERDISPDNNRVEIEIKWAR